MFQQLESVIMSFWLQHAPLLHSMEQSRGNLEDTHLGSIDGYLWVSDAPMQSDPSIVLEGGCLCTDLWDRRTHDSGIILIVTCLTIHLQFLELCLVQYGNSVIEWRENKSVRQNPVIRNQTVVHFDTN